MCVCGGGGGSILVGMCEHNFHKTNFEGFRYVTIILKTNGLHIYISMKNMDRISSMTISLLLNLFSCVVNLLCFGVCERWIKMMYNTLLYIQTFFLKFMLCVGFGQLFLDWCI